MHLKKHFHQNTIEDAFEVLCSVKKAPIFFTFSSCNTKIFTLQPNKHLEDANVHQLGVTNSWLTDMSTKTKILWHSENHINCYELVSKIFRL